MILRQSLYSRFIRHLLLSRTAITAGSGSPIELHIHASIRNRSRVLLMTQLNQDIS